MKFGCAHQNCLGETQVSRVSIAWREMIVFG
jgi:hypothetical protein